MASQDFQHCFGWCGKDHSVNEVKEGPGKAAGVGNILVLNGHKPCRDEASMVVRESKHHSVLSLMRTSQQLREEVAAIYYGANTFTVEVIDMEFQRLGAWFETIGAHSKLLRNVELNVVGRFHHADMGASLTNAAIRLRTPDVLTFGGRTVLAEYLEKAMEPIRILIQGGTAVEDINKVMTITTTDMITCANRAKPKPGSRDYLMHDPHDVTCYEEETEGRDWDCVGLCKLIDPASDDGERDVEEDIEDEGDDDSSDSDCAW